MNKETLELQDQQDAWEPQGIEEQQEILDKEVNRFIHACEPQGIEEQQEVLGREVNRFILMHGSHRG